MPRRVDSAPCIPWIAAALVCVGLAHAADEAPARHRVIVERKVELLDERLSQLARAGYRFLDASDGAGGFSRSSEFRLHLERTPAGSPPVDYRIVSGEYSGKLVERLDDAGAEGFEIHPRAILRKALPNPLGQPATPQAETPVLILERDHVGPPVDHELVVPGTARQLERELARSTISGFSLVGLRAFQGGWILAVLARPIVERSPEPRTGQGEPPYVAIDEREREKLFREVGAAAKRGFRVVTTLHRPFGSRGELILMTHAVPTERPYSYYFLGLPADDELEQRLNEGAEAGYRFRSGLDPRVELIMERAPFDRVDVRYRTVGAASASELERTISEALADGWAWSGLHGDVVVLERSPSVP